MRELEHHAVGGIGWRARSGRIVGELTMATAARFTVVVSLLVLAACSHHTTASQPRPTTTSTALVTTTVAPTTVAPTTTVAPVDRSIAVYGDCKTPTVEPRQIVMTCADYGEILDNLHWTSWTARSASAVGTLVYNDCTPNCAEGHHHSVPDLHVTLTRPVRGATSQLVWSQVEYSPKPPGYQPGPESLPVRPT